MLTTYLHFFVYFSFKDKHDEIRFLELRRMFKIGEKIGKTFCRDNDLFIFKLCKKIIKLTFGGSNSEKELEIETVNYCLISQHFFFNFYINLENSPYSCALLISKSECNAIDSLLPKYGLKQVSTI
jgi:hypothetical protein